MSKRRSDFSQNGSPPDPSPLVLVIRVVTSFRMSFSLFEELAKKKPNSFAGRQYKLYKLAAGVVCSKRLLNQAVGKSLRTHNLKPKKGAQVMRKNEKITALYERLSRDDFGKDDDQQRESNSTGL